ncbi:hypothetical protein EJB05_14756, partial [Eragrostis curvula]
MLGPDPQNEDIGHGQSVLASSFAMTIERWRARRRVGAGAGVEHVGDGDVSPSPSSLLGFVWIWHRDLRLIEVGVGSGGAAPISFQRRRKPLAAPGRAASDPRPSLVDAATGFRSVILHGDLGRKREDSSYGKCLDLNCVLYHEFCSPNMRSGIKMDNEINHGFSLTEKRHSCVSKIDAQRKQTTTNLLLGAEVNVEAQECE